jgi:hypothetical protein
MYILVTIVNEIIYLKFSERVDLKCFITYATQKQTTWGDRRVN